MGAADLVALVVSLAVASTWVFGSPDFWRTGPQHGSLLPLAAFFALGGFAGSFFVRNGNVPRPSYLRGLLIVGLGLMAVLGGIVFARVYWSRPFLAATTVMWLVGVTGNRIVSMRRPWTEPIVVIGAEKPLIDDLRDAPHVELVRVIDPNHQGEIEPLLNGETLAVDFRSVLSERMAQFVSSASVAGLPIRSFTALYEEHTGRLPVVHFAEGWEVTAPLSRTEPWLAGKRVFDLGAVMITAPLWLLFGVLVAVAVKLGSPRGPVIFRQRRVGLRGKEFTLFKFRTMRTDAEVYGPRFAGKDDTRIYPAGRLLRRYRLDELPQLWNVVRGDLSIVGPRPEQAEFVREFSRTIPFYEYRHLIRPGLTGWAQVSFGYADDEADTIEKLTYDLYYVKHMSPIFDLQILAQSIATVARADGSR